MKKLLTITMVGAVLSAPAAAVQKCVALNTGYSGCSGTASYGDAEWNVTCNTSTSNGTVTVNVKGIAMCTNTTASSNLSQYTTADTLGTDSIATSTIDETNNMGCWCKIISPAVSKWVYMGLSYPNTQYPNAKSCGWNCSYQCANMLIGDKSMQYKSALFTNLSE